jgi:hypothetical protein
VLVDETVPETAVLKELEGAAVPETDVETEGLIMVPSEAGTWDPEEIDEVGTADSEPGEGGPGIKVMLPGRGTVVLPEGVGKGADGLAGWVAEQSCSVTVTVTASRASIAEATTAEAVR